LGVEKEVLEVLSVGTIGRGGIGLLCTDPVSPGLEIAVSVYAKNRNRVVVAELILGKVVSMLQWKDSRFWLNICFERPISEKDKPALYRHLIELESQLV